MKVHTQLEEGRDEEISGENKTVVRKKTKKMSFYHASFCEWKSEESECKKQR